MKGTYTYPGDPKAEVELTYGGDFKAGNPGREIAVGAWGDPDPVRIPVEEVVCDSCNANVGDFDPCAIALDRLYCWDCYKRWVQPHLDQV